MLTFFRKKMKAILIVVVFVFAASMFYGVTMSRGLGGGEQKAKGLAKINGKEISPYRYQEMMARLIQQFGANIRPEDLAFVENLALGQTIDFALILSQAKKKVRVSGHEVNLALESIIKQEKLSSQKELEQALKRMGLSIQKFKGMLKDEMMVQKMVGKIRGEVKVGPDDLREVKASHILVSTEVQAIDLLARVKKGEDFSALAKEFSVDPGSGKMGGDLGFFTTGMMVEPFEKAAFSMKVGDVSDLVKTQFGYHIIMVTDSRLRKFDGKETDIEKAALAQKQEAVFRKWYSDIRSKARVEIISAKLRGHDYRFKGMLLEAVQEYQKAIVQNPSNPFLYLFLGEAYNSLGKTDLALAEYEKAVEIDGSNLDLYIILAEAYEKAGKKDLALTQYRRASMVAGDNKAQHERLLEILNKLKAWEEIKREKAEIKRIEKKEQFEKDLQGEE